MAAIGAACGVLALAACSADRVYDPARYWFDRVSDATMNADPSND